MNNEDTIVDSSDNKKDIAVNVQHKDVESENDVEDNSEEPIVDVIFRKFKDHGDIIAIFPGEIATMDSYLCMSYMHVGQHSACNPSHIVGMTKLATPEEYKDLKDELENLIGYKLNVMKRIQHRHLEEREVMLRKIMKS